MKFYEKYIKSILFFYSSIQFTEMNDYEIIKELGSGAFGRVFKVLCKKDNTIHAMKQIKMRQLNQKQKQNALSQVKILATVTSPNIITFKTAFFIEQSNVLCIVMQFADGGDLQGILKNKIKDNSRVEEEFIWKIAFDLLNGMKFMHENKIIHRDIKTGNVFIANGLAKLGDLNLSKIMEDDFAMTQTGSPAYISPQIWKGVPYDEKCDIWSFGCLLYELCAFKPPFNCPNIPLLIQQISQGKYDPIPNYYSPQLSQFIRKCLTVDVYRRPSAKQLLECSIFRDLNKQKQQLKQPETLHQCKQPNVLKMISNYQQKQLYNKKSVNMQQIKFVPVQNNHRFISNRNYIVSNMHRENQPYYIQSHPREYNQTRRYLSPVVSPQIRKYHSPPPTSPPTSSPIGHQIIAIGQLPPPQLTPRRVVSVRRY